ncbi:MAG TPA: hypothetical protein VK886_21815 [Vicinamibacterales bacterium]|nr:hypothetical protein [Vicinamibacterales bacterium]
MPTTLKLLGRRISQRGGICTIWLAYEQPAPTAARPAARPRLARAFWTEEEAREWAAAERRYRPGVHVHIYRVIADTEWVKENLLRRAQHVVSHGAPDDAEQPDLTVTPGAVAEVL